MEQISEDLSLLYSYVKIMFFSKNESQESIQAANEWLCNWSQNEIILDEYEYIFNQFSENANDPCYQNVLFITIKALQEFIRQRFDAIPCKTIEKIISNVYDMIMKKGGMCVTKEYLMMILCDLLTLSQNLELVPEIINKLPNDNRLNFVALFFEVGQENYLKRYPISITIQAILTPEGITILENEKMSREWLRISKALLPYMDHDLFLNRFSLLIPKFFNALDDIESIKMVVDIMSNIYVYSIEEYDFLLNFLNFTIEFSTRIREIVNGNEYLINCLFSLWDGFFQFDCYNITSSSKFYKVFVNVTEEIFNVCTLFPVDFDMWGEMCNNIIVFFQSFDSSHPVKNLLLDLFRLFYNILNFGVSIKLIKDSIKSLSKLSTECLCRYLEEEQKSFETLLIAGYNSSYLPQQLLEVFAEFLISSDVHPSYSLIFINQSYKYLPQYLSKFIFIIQKYFFLLPVQAAKTFYKIVKDKHLEISKLIPNILEISNLLLESDSMTLLYLIPSLLYLLLDIKTENSNEIYQMIGSILVQHLNSEILHNINKVLDYIIFLTNISQKSPKKTEIKPESSVRAFYSFFFTNVSQMFQQIYLFHNSYFQKILCKYFIYILNEEQTNNYNFFIEWLENIASDGRSLVYDHFVLLTILPLDSCPKMLQYISLIDENTSNDIISGVSYFMKFISIYHSDLFWKYFSIQLVLFLAKNNHFSLSFLIKKNSNINFLTTILKVLLNITKTQQGIIYYQEITNLIQLIIKQIPTDVLISTFSDTFNDNNEIIYKYIELLSKDENPLYSQDGNTIITDYFNYIYHHF